VTQAADEGGLIDEGALARVLGVDVPAVRRAVHSKALTPAEKSAASGFLFDLDAVRHQLAPSGWDGREPLLTAEQAAGRLGIDRSELNALVRDGKLNPVEPLPGVPVRYPSSEVELIIDGGRVVAAVTRARQGLRLVGSNVVLIIFILLALFPFVVLIRGSAVLAAVTQPRSVTELIGEILAGLALLLGSLFFCYSVRYYLATIIVLASAAPWVVRTRRERREGRIALARERDPSHLNLGYFPLVSIHIATYNEEQVIGRLLEACEKLEYPNYEVILVDDSTDSTPEIVARWASDPRFKIIHRTTRSGFKGGALRVALEAMNSQAEYVAVFDADAVPFPDSIDRLLPHFYEIHGGRAHRRNRVAAVQSYQWHVLNRAQNWLTEAVRAEYSGSYMIERPFQQALGAMKMVAGTAYMIRSDVLRGIGWGTSITEDWELTLHLYTLGYKVVYTPFAEAPAECVSSLRKLARQRMRWAEGHSFNVKKWFIPIFTSPEVSFIEKVEFAFYVTYYLQALLLLIGTLAWVVAELGLHAHIPGWIAVLGWSLLIANLLSLPIMNAAGLFLEEASARDFRGALAAIVTAYVLVPYQAWAALKGLLELHEGGWERTPKTGRLTGAIQHLWPVQMVQEWAVGLPPRQQPSKTALISQTSARRRRMVPRLVTLSILFLVVVLIAGAFGTSAAANTGDYYLHRDQTMDHSSGGNERHATLHLAAGTTATWTSTDTYDSGMVVPAGTYTFTANWQGGENEYDEKDEDDDGGSASITFTVGYDAGNCSAFTPLVSWDASVSASPDPSSTTGSTTSATTLGSGGPFHICFQLFVNSSSCDNNKERDDEEDCLVLLFDSDRYQAILSLPAIEVSEHLLPLAPLGLMIPVAVAWGTRRWLWRP
jgi:cellulose synthase/poly-beta-1,6-N-acetylglucosamine synthase-like glycosyltransferase